MIERTKFLRLLMCGARGLAGIPSVWKSCFKVLFYDNVANARALSFLDQDAGSMLKRLGRAESMRAIFSVKNKRYDCLALQGEL